MLGTGVRIRTIKRISMTRQHTESCRIKENISVNDEFDLLKKFQKMRLDVAPLFLKEKHKIKLFCPAFQTQQRRYYSSTPTYYKPASKDRYDLNVKGFIKEEILTTRATFLKEHGLLENKIDYLGRTVFANYQLYDLDQIDLIGRSNLQRMQSGFCPLDKTGTDIICIHHFDQTMEGAWVILPNVFHQQYSQQLHSEVSLANGVNRKQFAKQRSAYWKHQAALHLKVDSYIANHLSKYRRL